MPKPALAILIAVLLLGTSIIVLCANRPIHKFWPQNNEVSLAFITPVKKDNGNELKKAREPKIKIYLTGDIMLNRGVEYQIEKQGKGDFRFPFFHIAPELEKADILFGNLEGPISDRGSRVGSIYSFRAKPKAAEGLTYAGFDILSLANNHMFDYGRTAMEDTMEILSENGIDYVGAGFDDRETFSVKIKEVKGAKIGFLAYTNLGPQSWQAGPGTSGIAWIDAADTEKIKKAVQEAKQKTDVLIVSLHSGEEYTSEPSPFQISFAKAAIESGADLVVEHHPHTVQRVEKYGNGWIAYSLGNFVFDQGFSDSTMRGLLLEATIEGRKIKEVIPKEVKINEFFQPILQVF